MRKEVWHIQETAAELLVLGLVVTKGVLVGLLDTVSILGRTFSAVYHIIQQDFKWSSL